MRLVKSTSVKDEEIFKKQFVKTADGRYVKVLVSCNISDEAMISFRRKPYDCGRYGNYGRVKANV